MENTANRPNGKGVALGDDYSFQSGNFNAGVLEKGEVYDGNKMQYSGSWNAGKLHGNGKIISMSKELYNGGFLHGKRHGNGVCNGGEQPIRCEYFYDRRVDTVYLAEAFNKDLNVFNQTFRKNKAQVNRKHDAIENRWQQSKRSKLDGYDNRISRYETELVTIGALDMFSAGLAAQNSGGNTNQAMAARSEKYGRKIEQARVDKEKARVRLEREYQQKKPEWDRKRAQDLQKILAEFELKRRDFIAKNAKFCQSIPNKKWVGEPEFLCKSI